MREQGGLVGERRGEIAADQAQVGVEARRRRAAGDERVHPGSAALVLTRVPVGVETAQGGTVAVIDCVVADLDVPGGHAALFHHPDAVETAGQLEQARHHALQREIGAQLLLIEIVERLALLLGPVGHIPGVQLAAPGKDCQLAVLAPEVLFGLTAQILDEGQGARTLVGHAVFKHQVGKGGVAQQLGLFAAQLQNTGHQLAVVVRCGRGADAEGVIHLAAYGFVVEIGHYGDIAGRLQGESPALAAFALGALPGGLQRAHGQPGEALAVSDHELIGIGRIEDVFGELGGEPGQLHVDLLEAFLAGGVQVGAVAAEIVDGLLQEASPDPRERPRLTGGGIALDIVPQTGIERDAGVEGAHRRLHRIVGGAQLGIGGHRFQVAHHGHGAVEGFGEAVARRQGVLVCPRSLIGGQDLEPGTRFFQQALDGGFHVGSLNPIKRYAKSLFQ